jgi:D-glycero-D-manno-heptose 1,7-bisphosphate phosphatase
VQPPTPKLDFQPAAEPAAVAAVLFDRDGTLIADVPFDNDPAFAVPMPYARVALERLRRAKILTAVVTNQSGVAAGYFERSDVDRKNARVEALLGPLGPFLICAHAETDGCDCRKPAPGLIVAAAALLGVPLEECVVIGDIGSDMQAARAAGARAILVPTPATRPEEIAAAPNVAANLGEAIDVLLRGLV